MKNKLIGHSGCDLSLINENGVLLVEKKANKKDYNCRLQFQCEKQEQYFIREGKTAEIVEKGYSEDGLFYFKMKYLSGITLAEHVRSVSLIDIHHIVNEIFPLNYNNLQYDENANEIFLKKILELKEKVDLNNVRICEAINILESYNWKYVEKSPCHGDFTLENMILTNNHVSFIDFLDSFYDSWMIDLAKILQDVELHWHYRKETTSDMNLEIRLLIIKYYLFDKIKQNKKYDKIMECIYHILLLNIIRIFPYTTDEETYLYLLDKVIYVEQVIKDKKWNE